MKCKNCGAELPMHSKVCFNCGQSSEKAEDYVLLTDFYEDYDSTEIEEAERLRQRKRRRRKGIGIMGFTIVAIIFIVICAVVSFLYFDSQNNKKEQPSLSFTSGCGIINDNEKVLYADFTDSSVVQYIHGVSVYKADKLNPEKISGSPVCMDYEYTKNIDGSFRCVYVDLKNLDDKAKAANYVFEIKIGYISDDNIYSYYQPVSYDKKNMGNISEVVFDHSLAKDPNDHPPIKEEKIKKVDSSFVTDYVWYAHPDKTEVKYLIYIYEFYSDGRCLRTRYENYFTSQYWTPIEDEYLYTIRGDKLTIVTSDGLQSEVLTIDPKNKLLFSGSLKFEPKQNKSIENIEDIFGID